MPVIVRGRKVETITGLQRTSDNERRWAQMFFRRREIAARANEDKFMLTTSIMSNADSGFGP